MRRRLVALSTAVALLAPGVAVAARADRPQPRGAGDVVATADATTASLANGLVARTWSLAGGVRTTGLVGAGGSWAGAGDDFAVNVDGVPTTSTLGWSLLSVTPTTPPALPGRPASGTGRALLFRYVLIATPTAPAGVELDRLVVLHPGSSVLETTSTLVDRSPAPVRVSSYTLDQITAKDAAGPAEVQAYNGGSDWRDDYRHVSTETGAFDAEGEVLRVGNDSGFFLVSQRRGGSMSRAGRDSTGRSYVGVDWAHDLFDWGPLQTSPPNYNRLDNPADPVPVRARLVRPLESLDLGTAFLGVYSGGADEAAAAFTRDFVGAAQPAFARSVGLNTFHPWSHGDGMSDANLRTQVDVAKSLGLETFMLDDQWQGGAGGESGDWNFDPARFPDTNGDGVPDFVSYLHQAGLQLGLWMSPLEFNGASQTYAAHPDWACAPIGDATAQVQDDAGLGVWDATNPAFQTYLLGVIDRLVAAYDVREFKFDFMAWVDCAGHARIGSRQRAVERADADRRGRHPRRRAPHVVKQLRDRGAAVQVRVVEPRRPQRRRLERPRTLVVGLVELERDRRVSLLHRADQRDERVLVVGVVVAGAVDPRHEVELELANVVGRDQPVDDAQQVGLEG
ncbi:MAG TPA: alpha-galactosidase, partial [Mycobacteriales bacterium]|nr:alpha-galactosidase [Mycobacteriales bacterium]